MKFNYQLSFNFEGKITIIFSNNEIKSHFFCFTCKKVAVSSHNSKKCCIFAANSYLWSHTTELLNTNCGLCTAGSTCDVLSIVAPRRGSLYNKYTRGNQTRNAKNNGRKNQNQDIAERAGVSVGTVDRVLHDRPNVSKPARDKVEKASRK